jgi:hypothetical protein
MPFSGESLPTYRRPERCPSPTPGSGSRKFGTTVIRSAGRPPAIIRFRWNSVKAMYRLIVPYVPRSR